MANILISDDNRDFAQLLQMMLTSMGHTPHVTFNGAEAIALLKEKNDFDLIITDIIMPEVDGLDLIEYASQNTQMKIIAISGGGVIHSADKVAQAIGDKVHASLQKPLQQDALIETIESALAS